MIKFIFLDLDDTILDFHKGESQAMGNALRGIGIEPDERLITRYMEINVGLWRALERGEINRDQVIYGRFERLFEEFSINEDCYRFQKIYQELLAKEHEFIPGAKELLDALRNSGKYSLYIATNGIPEVQWPRINGSGIRDYFDDIFISYDFGVGKPSRQFFERCFEKIPGFNPDECIIVGDNPTSDIKGGINAGIKTCHFDRRSTIYTDIIPDYRITNILELLELLDTIE